MKRLTTHLLSHNVKTHIIKSKKVKEKIRGFFIIIYVKVTSTYRHKSERKRKTKYDICLSE